jgi:hypothetical protein
MQGTPFETWEITLTIARVDVTAAKSIAHTAPPMASGKTRAIGGQCPPQLAT